LHSLKDCTLWVHSPLLPVHPKWVMFCKVTVTFFGDLLVRNTLSTWFLLWNATSCLSKYSIGASVWNQYSCIRCIYAKLRTHNWAAPQRILWLTDQIERVTIETGPIMRPRAFICIPLR
jgi:hypothetical protein